MDKLSKFAPSIGALLVSLWGGYQLYIGQPTQMDQLKFVILTSVGVLYLVSSNLDSIKSIFSRAPTSERVFFPAEFEKRDLECLIHLRNRLTEAGCEEGVETCEKLNTIVFSLHAKEKLVKKVVNKNA